MSNIANDLIMEGLGDEFYDDPQRCIEWMISQGAHVEGLDEIDLCDLYVEMSMPYIKEL